MSKAEANITVPVDLTNPGQFFACCGLLELAARIDSGSYGRFVDSRFLLKTRALDVLEKFFRCTVEVDSSDRTIEPDEGGDVDAEANPDEAKRGRIYPMRLREPFDLLLNWWTEKEAQESKLKLWTAGQRVTDLLNGHYKKKTNRGSKASPDTIVKVYTPSTREHFETVVRNYPADWLRTAVPIEAPAAFSFDSRLSRNNSLDLGHFSGGVFAFSPGVDVLSLVGLQRFRPEVIEVWNRNRYFTWSEPLPVTVAPLAVLGQVPSLADLCFEFPIKARDSQGRFKLFGHAQPARRPHV